LRSSVPEIVQKQRVFRKVYARNIPTQSTELHKTKCMGCSPVVMNYYFKNVILVYIPKDRVFLSVLWKCWNGIHACVFDSRSLSSSSNQHRNTDNVLPAGWQGARKIIFVDMLAINAMPSRADRIG